MQRPRTRTTTPPFSRSRPRRSRAGIPRWTGVGPDPAGPLVLLTRMTQPSPRPDPGDQRGVPDEPR